MRLFFTTAGLIRAGLSSLLLLCCGPGAGAQETGRWLPPGAVSSYPRTLLTAAELPAVQASLTAGPRQAIYQSLAAGIAALPADNTSAGGRRDRATFAKNAAFVALLDRQPDAPAQPLSAPERARLLTEARTALQTLNPAVEPFLTFTSTPYTEWQWRSKELIDYLIAYDLLRGAGETEASLAAARSQLQRFAANLYQESNRPFMGFTFFRTIKNNHALMTAAALGMAAVVLNDATGPDAAQQPLSWINAGLFNLDNVLWQDAQRQSDPAALTGYAEGPYYFKYAFLNCLPFFRALGHFLPDTTLSYRYGTLTRSIPHPYFDARYDRLYEWITAIRMPDGRFPALEDSYVDLGMPELALTGKARYLSPLHLSRLAPGQLGTLTAQLRDVTVDMRAAYLAANLEPAPAPLPALTALPGSGNLVLRSAPGDSTATYLHLYGKHGPALANSGGHNHGDAGSFILHARGQLLALDAGYLSYSRRGEAGHAQNHNLVLVDGAGPLIGSTGSANDAAATVQNAFQTEQLTYGEVQTGYQGASITRKALLVRGSYVLLADAIAAPATHSYTWQLHGYGLEGGTAATGTFTDSLARHAGLWQKNGVGLLAHVTATGGASYAKARSQHELSYNNAEPHTVLQAQAGGTQPQFLAALHPFTAQAPRVLTSSTATTAGLVSLGAFRDVAFAQADTLLAGHAAPGLPQPLQADGRLNFLSLDSAGQFAQLLLEQGTQLRYGPDALLRSSRRATASWQRTGPAQYAGYASRATTLTLHLAQPPLAVSGAGLSSYSYDADAQLLQVVLSQAGGFGVSVQASGRVLPVELLGLQARRSGPAVQLSWQTASEHHNAGFVVERRTGTEPDFRQIGYVPGAGTATTARRYAYLDAAAPAGPAYYRLRQIDHDGTASLSPVAAVAAATGRVELSAAPNPADATLDVALPGAEGTLQLLDAHGRRVLRQPFRQQTRLDVRGLPAGLYYLQLQTAGLPVPTRKVLVLH